ncbi:AraC family transcriptional regulator [Lacibacter luteus]|uniref:AraC family transcriptional regulator n=1 Tax=Lacibacter luteus TaxID=2508719 RepID=A0A4Q1CL46_9BACT|nr:AraC family transcriptional regulator [Lacibacter luteus]RXK61703.1 AraC family transcriptional regulator [Lacibacter luteus]
MARNQPKQVKKQEGFEGQRMIVLPKKIERDILLRDAIIRPLFITDIGYYPKARHHYVHRKNGCDQYIFIYCTKGKGWIEYNRKHMLLLPSQFVIIPANAAHKYGADENDPWSIYWFHFKGKLATAIVDLLVQKIKTQQPHIVHAEEMIRLFDLMYGNLEKGYSVDNLRFINMTLYHFLASLLYEDQFRIESPNRENNMIAAVIAHMQKNIDSVFTLQELAGFANLSSSHFSALFRTATGYPPMEYFNQLKIQKACQLLLFTDRSVKEIAHELGINDPYYFSRMFTKLMEMSPSIYRSRKRQLEVLVHHR